MAKIPDGILGKFIGKAGPVSGYIWNGQNLLRPSSRSGTITPTPKRIAQQQKMKLCNGFTRAFTGTDFFNKSFPANGHTGTGYNRATSALMNRAIVGSYPDTAISYPLVMVSRGLLPAAENASAMVNANKDIFFSWTDNSGDGTARENDKVILVAFFAAEPQVIYSLNNATRADCRAILPTHTLKGQVAETWIGFLSSDEKDAADSVYTGSLNL